MDKKTYNSLSKIIKVIDRNSYDVFIAFLIVINIAPLVAPILMSLGLQDLAKIIYDFYAFLCHQISWRSIHFHDYQYAWCVRDTFIWLNVLLMGMVIRNYRLPKVNKLWLLLFVLPIALDGGIQTIATIFGLLENGEAFYVSNNFFRMLTGTLFGIGLGMFLLPILLNDHLIAKQKQLTITTIKFIVSLLLVNIVIYSILLLAWKFSSTETLPQGLLDQEIKAPANVETWLERCENCK